MRTICIRDYGNASEFEGRDKCLPVFFWDGVLIPMLNPEVVSHVSDRVPKT